DLPRRGHSRDRRDGGDSHQERGSAVLPVRRRARRGGPGGESSHPLRRRGLSFPATRLDVAMNDTVVAIVSAFFVIGILVGIIIVVAMSVLRADRRRDPGDLLDDE